MMPLPWAHSPALIIPWAPQSPAASSSHRHFHSRHPHGTTLPPSLPFVHSKLDSMKSYPVQDIMLPCGLRIFFLYFSALFLIPLSVTNVVGSTSNDSNVEVNVGAIYGKKDWIGVMGFTCIQMALADFYASNPHYKTRISLYTRDSNQDVVGAAAAALYLIEKVEVKAILGPMTSMEAEFVTFLGAKAQVPIVSYSATSPFLSSIQSPYFVRAAQDDSTQAQVIAAMVQAFGWREVVPIHIDNDYGEGIMPYLMDSFQQISARIPYTSVLSSYASDDQILEELYKIQTMQTRVFVVHMSANDGSRLFANANKAGMLSEGYAWIVTNGVGNFLDSLDHDTIENMQGVLAVQTYVPKTQKLDNFINRWKLKIQEDRVNFPKSAKLNVIGLWAYDAASALARAVEKVLNMSSFFVSTNNNSSSTDLDSIKVSQIGPMLLQAILRTKFEGLAGVFSLNDGQLLSSTYQIVNVIGNSGRGIGFWTPDDGLSKDLNINIQSISPTPNLRTIIWPGDTSSVPKGWVIPTSGTKLKIGVPIRPGFEEFVTVTHDAVKNITTVSGYCIDVFDAAMRRLPYFVPYEYVAFVKPDNFTSAGSYDDLISQVYFKKYDAVVGDVTIIANRSNYVDFTQPYTDSGVIMVVPVKDANINRAWIFLKPLTWELWVTSFCFFVFIAFLVWLLEHRISDEFRGGSPLQQIGTSLYYSLCTMVFAQKENVVSNLARLVVVVWMFVVLILTQSYTASLTSMLTVQQIQPTVTNLNVLLNNGEYVGYQEGSFVGELLIQLGFKETKLRAYSDPEQLDELLRNGSAHGGIAAVLDEIPYMNLFLSNHCSYTMVQPTYKTGGFGFVFPLGSPLLPDVSRAILNVTEGHEMVLIEQKWGLQPNSCQNSSAVPSTTSSLGVDSFWGLFLIVGTFALIAICISTGMFLYEQRRILMCPDLPFFTRIRILAKKFDQRDLEFYTFRKAEQRHVGIAADAISSAPNTDFPPSPRKDIPVSSPSLQIVDVGVVDERRNTDCPPSPSSYTSNAEGNTFCFSGGASPSTELAEPASLYIESND
ncbi:Glutamate receptor 2.7-like protein [Drosera capensis]